MEFLSTFLPLYFIWFLALITPGPDFFITLKHALSSRRSGIFTALGLGTGMMVHVAYCILGLALVISRSIVFFNILKFAGALYLIYIGWKSFRSEGAHMKIQKEGVRRSAFQAYRIGLFTNILNPKATLFFLGLFTVGIKPDTPVLHQAIFGLALGAGTMIWFSLVSIFFSQQKIQVLYQRFSRRINQVFGALLIALGLKIALTER